ncbi:MAG: hypothetical protein ICV83_16570 [Cytophagales bacterium]|nr:hypothetical protein [Cytophagales bacterium]
MSAFSGIGYLVMGAVTYGNKHDASTASNRQFKAFRCLWGVATLFHLAHSDLFGTRFHYILMTLVAVWIIFKPATGLFLLLISLQLVDAFDNMPVTSNHWLFTAFVNITILQALLYHVVKNKSFRVEESRWLETFAPVVRIEVLILYFYAVFHKINAGFFTPASSCATELLKAQHLDAVIPLSPAVFMANAYFTLFVEAAIPILLCFRRTRNWGGLLGVVFHFILAYSSYNAFFDFSSMVFALYALFISPGFFVTLMDGGRKLKQVLSREAPPAFSPARLLMLLGFWLAAMVAVLFITRRLYVPLSYYWYAFWTGYGLLCIALLGWFMRTKAGRQANETASLSFSVPGTFFLLVPILVFLNGLSPYLGLKTENSFSMFSNLRTEGNVTNHYLVPVSLQVFDYQKDVVEIVSSTDSVLQKTAAENKIWVFFEFKNYVAKRKPARVTYIRNGQRQEFVLQAAAPGDELLTRDLLMGKLLRFRPFRKTEPQPCGH